MIKTSFVVVKRLSFHRVTYHRHKAKQKAFQLMQKIDVTIRQIRSINVISYEEKEILKRVASRAIELRNKNSNRGEKEHKNQLKLLVAA